MLLPEMIDMLLGKAVSRALAAQGDFGPVLSSLRNGPAFQENDATGTYDTGDNYISYMLAGDACGDKPVGP